MIERREHKKDSNRDSNSEFETVNLHIINTNYDDIGYYLCIVANSASSYRSTYSYLNVLNYSKTTTTYDDDETNAALDQYLMRKNNKFENFLKENKYLAIIIASIVGISGVILIILFIYCCSSRIAKNISKLQNNNQFDKINMFNDSKMPTMNLLIEKSMNNMRKVIKINLKNILNIYTIKSNLEFCLRCNG
jgi:hypothetical protein